MLKLVVSSDKVSLGVIDDEQVEALFEETVHHSREILAKLIRRWEYGISTDQLYADGIRPTSDLALLTSNLEHLILDGVVVSMIWERVTHNEKRLHGGVEHILGERAKYCLCDPEVLTRTKLFHRNHVHHADLIKKTFGYREVA